MKAEGIDAEVFEGEKSQFDVVADGQVVFSKQQLGRFPTPGEATKLITAA